MRTTRNFVFETVNCIIAWRCLCVVPVCGQRLDKAVDAVEARGGVHCRSAAAHWKVGGGGHLFHSSSLLPSPDLFSCPCHPLRNRFLSEMGPLNPARGSGDAVGCPSSDQGRDLAENTSDSTEFVFYLWYLLMGLKPISVANWLPSVLWRCWLGHLACKNRPQNDL